MANVELTWQPEDTATPQTVYVFDVDDHWLGLLRDALEHPERYEVLDIPNVAITPGGLRRTRVFRVSRLVGFEVMP